MYACVYPHRFLVHIYVHACTRVRMRDERTSRESYGTERSGVTENMKSYVVDYRTLYACVCIHVGV
jgi:hypothetical protein